MEAVLVVLPAVSDTGLPELVPSTTNCTAPVGAVFAPLVVLVTVAVKVTFVLSVEGLAPGVTVGVVEAGVEPLRLIVCVVYVGPLALRLFVVRAAVPVRDKAATCGVKSSASAQLARWFRALVDAPQALLPSRTKFVPLGEML